MIKWGDPINEELRAIYQADQADRQPPIDWTTMARRDVARRARVEDLIAAGALQVAADYYHAAMIFQHGPTPDYHWRAHELAKQAAEMGAPPVARWLAAAALDRWLVGQEKPQKYGTQYRWQDDHWVLRDVDPATTDEERAAWNVPPLAQARARTEHIPPPPPHHTAQEAMPPAPLATWEAHGLKIEFRPPPPREALEAPTAHHMSPPQPMAPGEATIPDGLPVGAVVCRMDQSFVALDASGQIIVSWNVQPLPAPDPLIIVWESGQPAPTITDVNLGDCSGALIDCGEQGKVVIWRLSPGTCAFVAGLGPPEQLLTVASSVAKLR